MPPELVRTWLRPDTPTGYMSVLQTPDSESPETTRSGPDAYSGSPYNPAPCLEARGSVEDGGLRWAFKNALLEVRRYSLFRFFIRCKFHHQMEHLQSTMPRHRVQHASGAPSTPCQKAWGYNCCRHLLACSAARMQPSKRDSMGPHTFIAKLS